MFRPRPSHACRECRRRKLRCDTTRPSCAKCTASRLTCVYDGGSAGTRDFQFVQSSLAPSRGQSSTAGGQASAEEVIVSTSRLKSLEEKLERLTAQVQALQRTTSAESSVLPSDELPNDLTQDSTKRLRTTASAESSQDSSGAGHLLVQPGGRLRYVSHGHWAAMCGEAGEIELLLRAQTRYDLVDDQKPPSTSYYGTLVSPPPVWDTSQPISSRVSLSSPIHTLQILDRSRLDALFEAYISCVHPVVPLTHIPTLRRDYGLFWDLQRSGGSGTRDTMKTVPLILAALHAGAVVCQPLSFQTALSDTDLEHVATDFHHKATSALQRAYFPRVPTVSALAAYLILQGTWMREEEPLTTCSTLGVAVRVAQMLGLHRDPSHFQATIPPIQAEVQRRVWWHVFHCDVLVASASGLPPMIEQNSWDTKMVSNLYDNKIGTVGGLQHDAESRKGHLQGNSGHDASLVSPLGIWLHGKFKETLLERKLLDRAFSEDHMTLNDMISARDDLQLLRHELRILSQSISIDTSVDTYENNKQFNMWAKIILTTLGDKNCWFLHTPLLHRSISEAWQDLMPNLQLYCCAFLEQYLILCCDPDFMRFQWAWPGNHQPLHALVLVLKELERNPTGPHAGMSCTIIDQTMALCAPEGGITAGDGDSMLQRPLTEGGSEAWDFIRRLRAKVWTKIGLDADIMLTRDDVCVFVVQRMQDFKASGGRLDLRTPIPSDAIWQRLVHSATSTQPNTSFFPSPLPDVDTGSGRFNNPMIGGGGSGPTPNINWEDWDQIFNIGQDEAGLL